MDDRIALLQLARTEGVGPMTFAALRQRYGTAQGALKALRDEGRRVAGRELAEAELAAVAELGGQLLFRGTGDFPAVLATTPDAPSALTVRGDPTLLRRHVVAIVGARNASGNGRRFAHRLGRELASAGLVVVSGLARGIDTAAHEGALACGGATVAVIAAGADVAYPPENAVLMERIAAEGAVVSERPLGAQARAKDFPRRNRIIAGLGLGIVVVEAAPASGSLITARLALDYGREVMAVPGSPLDPRHKGTNQLLRDGAHLVESAEDVLKVLAPLQRMGEPPPVRARAMVPSRPRPQLQEVPAALTSDALVARVEETLGPAPLAVDELIRECDAPAPDVQAALLELELAGRIDRHPGNRVSLRAG